MDNQDQNYEMSGEQPEEHTSSFRLRESEETSTFRIKEPDGDNGDIPGEDTQSGYANTTNIPPETIISLRDSASKKKTAQFNQFNLAVLVLVLLVLDIGMVASYMKSREQIRFIKTHQTEYTECAGVASNVVCEKKVTRSRSRGRTRRRVRYVYTFDLSFTFQGKNCMLTGCSRTMSSNNLKDGDTVQIIIRDGAYDRAFTGKYDFLYGTMATNLNETGNRFYLIMIVIVNIPMIAVILNQAGGRKNANWHGL